MPTITHSINAWDALAFGGRQRPGDCLAWMRVNIHATDSNAYWDHA